MTVELAMVVMVILLGLSPEVRPCDSEEECIGVAAEIIEAVDVASSVTGIKAETLLVIAYYESGFNEERHGKLGHGVFGLNPRGRPYRDARAMCDVWPNHCLVAQAVVAGRYLEEERKRCGGMKGAIRSYGSGACDSPGGAKYLRGFYKTRRAFRAAAARASRP